MPNAANNNTGDPDHILKGQANWVPWFLRFEIDIQIEGTWPLFDGSEEILPKPRRPMRPARAGTDLTTTSDPSSTASNAVVATAPEATNTTSIDYPHQVFLYQMELEFHRMDLHDDERQQGRNLCARKMLYARIDRSMFATMHDDRDNSLASEFARLQSCYKPKPSLAMQLTRCKIDQISLATCKDMSEYLNKMRQLRQELAYAGETMTDMRYVDRLHDGLPARYDSWKDRYYDTVEDSSASEFSLVSFEGRLIHWEYKLNQ